MIAQGRHPSVDAVRVELGNTGSKSTIHKYLQELEVEYGGVDERKAQISEALRDLVSRLAKENNFVQTNAHDQKSREE